MFFDSTTAPWQPSIAELAVFVTLVTLAGWAVLVAVRRMAIGRLSRERVFREQEELGVDPEPQPWQRGPFAQWLARAGFRSRQAAPVFIASSLVGGAIGATCALAVSASGLLEIAQFELGEIPGGFGDVLVPVLLVAPWLVFLLLALLPFLYVRRARRTRIRLLENDLSPTLNLLATMAESGLGFDAAMAQILNTRLGRRPLAVEFRSYQADLLSGRSRVQAFRRLAQRTDVTSITIFCSAMAQADQIGMGIADILRRQADDLRDRRREQATAFAMSLAVKRIIPLVVCFLPGLFVWTLGPFFVQFFQLVDTLVQVRDF